MLTITLYTKDGCGLCDEVKAELAVLAAAYPHRLVEVDITQDADLFARYRYTIPVVEIGAVTLQAPITAVALIDALQTAVSS
ncbi:MAG: glutaredoxin family protein [Ardenticatenaceae bacterium]|nr:glutaredoxin family protein [Ardenticatenaceae bacterium]